MTNWIVHLKEIKKSFSNYLGNFNMQIRNEIKEFKKTPSETQTSEDYYYLLKV